MSELPEKDQFRNVCTLIATIKQVEKGELEYSERVKNKEFTQEELEDLIAKLKWDEIREILFREPGGHEQRSLISFQEAST